MALITLSPALDGRLRMLPWAFSMVGAFLLFKWDHKQTGMFVSGLRLGRTLPVSIALLLVMVGLAFASRRSNGSSTARTRSPPNNTIRPAQWLLRSMSAQRRRPANNLSCWPGHQRALFDVPSTAPSIRRHKSEMAITGGEVRGMSIPIGARSSLTRS